METIFLNFAKSKENSEDKHNRAVIWIMLVVAVLSLLAFMFAIYIQDRNLEHVETSLAVVNAEPVKPRATSSNDVQPRVTAEPETPKTPEAPVDLVLENRHFVFSL